MTRFQLLMQLAQTLIDEANAYQERHGASIRLCALKEMNEQAFWAEIAFVKALCAKLAKSDFPMQGLMDAGKAAMQARTEAKLKPGDEWGLGDVFTSSFRGYMKSLAEAEITQDDWPSLPSEMASKLISENYPE